MHRRFDAWMQRFGASTRRRIQTFHPPPLSIERQKLNEQLNVMRRARFSNGSFSMIFGRTDLWISQSRAKFDEEADFEVRSVLDPQKARLFDEKRNFRSENFADKFFWRRKVKRRESSETRFRKVSWRQNDKILTLPSDVNGHF